MTARGLLADLRRRGVELHPAGDRLRVRAPRGVLGSADLEALRRQKADLLAALAAEAPGPRPGAALEAAPIAEARERLAAVLLRSDRYGELWLVLDPCALPDLEAEEAARSEPRPILAPADVVLLRDRPEAAIRAALDVARVFPGSRVLS